MVCQGAGVRAIRIESVRVVRERLSQMIKITMHDPSRRPEEWTDQFRRRRR